IITSHPAIGVATGAGVPVGDSEVRTSVKITKRPRVRGPLFFLCFSRGRWTQPNHLRAFPLLYVPFFLFLAFFFMTLFLAVGPLAQSKYWQLGNERGVNRSWRSGPNIEAAAGVHPAKAR